MPRMDGDREFAADEYACTAVVEEQANFPEILGAYDAIAHWAKEHRREFAGSPREIYLSAPGEPTRWEVVWPLHR